MLFQWFPSFITFSAFERNSTRTDIPFSRRGKECVRNSQKNVAKGQEKWTKFIQYVNWIFLVNHRNIRIRPTYIRHQSDRYHWNEHNLVNSWLLGVETHVNRKSICYHKQHSVGYTASFIEWMWLVLNSAYSKLNNFYSSNYLVFNLFLNLKFTTFFVVLPLFKQFNRYYFTETSHWSNIHITLVAETNVTSFFHALQATTPNCESLFEEIRICKFFNSNFFSFSTYFFFSLRFEHSSTSQNIDKNCQKNNQFIIITSISLSPGT